MAHPRNDSERRISKREEVEPIEIKSFTSLDHLTLISRTGHIIDASRTGFLLRLSRSDLVPKQFRENLSLSVLNDTRVMLTIANMNLELSGRITRTKRLDKDFYEIAVDYSEDAEDYWRDLLFEMLTEPTEIDSE